MTAKNHSLMKSLGLHKRYWKGFFSESDQKNMAVGETQSPQMNISEHLAFTRLCLGHSDTDERIHPSCLSSV